MTATLATNVVNNTWGKRKYMCGKRKYRNEENNEKWGENEQVLTGEQQQLMVVVQGCVTAQQ